MSITDLVEQIRALLWQIEVATWVLVTASVMTVLAGGCELSLPEQETDAGDSAGDSSSTPSPTAGDE